MKAIVNYSVEEFNAQDLTLNELRAKVAGIKLFEDLKRQSRYAHYVFEGKCSAELIERLGRVPTADEVIMLVDGGFSHFGATCNVRPDGTFSGRVNTD